MLAAGGAGALAILANPFGIAQAAAQAATGNPNSFWIGTKKIAFFLVYTYIDQLDPSLEAAIHRRVNFDPDSLGADVSLRAFVRANSYGLADIEAHFIGMEQVEEGPGREIPVTALAPKWETTLRNQGFDGAFMVTLSGDAGIAQQKGFWSRAPIFRNVGMWAMELLHQLTGYGDLYRFANHLEVFDDMADAIGTHCSAFTKRAIGWLDEASIVTHTGRVRSYNLQALALAPAADRRTAIRVGEDAKYFIVEARLGVDQFDGRIPTNRQGVIVYQVEDPDTDPDPNRINPNLPLRTRNGLKTGEVFTSATGVQVKVTARFSDGCTVRIVDPAQRLLNRSGEFSTPQAAGRPTAAVVPGLGTHSMHYRDTSGRLWELWRDSAGRTGSSNLTAAAGQAPAAAGDPFAYVHQPTNTQILLYRDFAGRINSLYWSTGPVGHDNLSGTAGAPAAAGDPVGYHTPLDDTHHVIYRTSSGHLHELWWQGVAPVRYGGDLTALAGGGAPNAVGNPSAYSARGTNLVCYRGSDNRIHSLYWSTGAVGHDNLSGVAGTPYAAGEPFAYYTPFNDVHQVVYVGTNGHIYELYWQGVNAVTGWNLTAPAGAPPANGSLTAYYNAAENTKHVIYGSTDGRLHEIWWTPGGGIPAHSDLTTFAAAPAASTAPASFVTTDPNTQHVAYRSYNRIYEIAW
ncbi:hypothetical protein GCM10007977_011570 [Dactylosporangium sucinum]|uniref:Uncharacterized protein n=1 Tax=Dactylosporangium sucinum TaxID=1424081 RepID=A0A917T758_9ACTN|nr:hypothetical protein GCM10007977_011570 [Dactylosporangium sucinum]